MLLFIAVEYGYILSEVEDILNLGLGAGANFDTQRSQKYNLNDVCVKLQDNMDLSSKKPTQDLIEEHAGIALMLRILEKVAEKLIAGEEVKRDHLSKIVEFLRNFADKCHHGKEEGILFPEMLKNTANERLMNELLGEHKTGRDFIRGIAESLDNYQKGNPDAFHIAVNALGYSQLLTEHIRKENMVLFPAADKELPDVLQSQISERFEKLEIEVVGVGKHEEYHRWLEELKSVYLG